jgi:hypothetical protein
MGPIELSTMKGLFFIIPIHAFILGFVPTRRWFYMSIFLFLVVFGVFSYFAFEDLRKQSDGAASGLGLLVYYNFVIILSVASVIFRLIFNLITCVFKKFFNFKDF